VEQGKVTSEVAVLNRQCVVLAADSAMTVGGKIFNTVNKVFALSKRHPVGIMVYSSAQVMGVPVETVIKEFRRIRGESPRSHLEEYAEEFEAFLRDDNSLFTDEARLRSMTSLAWERTKALQNDAYGRVKYGWGHPTKREGRDALLKALEAHEKLAQSFSPIPVDSPTETRRRARKSIEAVCSDATNRLRVHFPVSASAELRILNLVLCHCLCSGGSGPETGFIIAGFGGQDVFPRLRAFEFCHSCLGIHKVESRVEIDIGDGTPARIAPFGQRDVIDTFTHGIHPEHLSGMDSFLRDFFAGKKEQFRSAPEVADFMERMGNELRGAWLTAQRKTMKEGFLDPLMTAVEPMPKDELAVLAEAVVNLTALKRRASGDAETVGGPVDVAIISKGDGLVWAKRKHYFDAKLNPTFVARYLEATDES
jgi:hypothetical protein